MSERPNYSVKRWRGLDPYEAMVWANMPIDRIETLIGIESELPNPREIAQKLQEEATEKEAYSPDAIPSILPQTLAQFWVKATFGFRHLRWTPSLGQNRGHVKSGPRCPQGIRC